MFSSIFNRTDNASLTVPAAPRSLRHAGVPRPSHHGPRMRLHSFMPPAPTPGAHGIARGPAQQVARALNGAAWREGHEEAGGGRLEGRGGRGQGAKGLVQGRGAELAPLLALHLRPCFGWDRIHGFF